MARSGASRERSRRKEVEDRKAWRAPWQLRVVAAAPRPRVGSWYRRVGCGSDRGPPFLLAALSEGVNASLWYAYAHKLVVKDWRAWAAFANRIEVADGVDGGGSPRRMV